MSFIPIVVDSENCVVAKMGPSYYYLNDGVWRHADGRHTESWTHLALSRALRLHRGEDA